MTEQEYVQSHLNAAAARADGMSSAEAKRLLRMVGERARADYQSTVRRPTPESQQRRVDAALQRQRDAGLLDAEPPSRLGMAADATLESVKDYGRSFAAAPGAIKKYGESLGEGAAEFSQDPRAALAGAAEGALESLPGRLATKLPGMPGGIREAMVAAAKQYRDKRRGISGVGGDASRDAFEATGDLGASALGGVLGTAAAGPAGGAVMSSAPGALKVALTGGSPSDVAQAFGHGIAADRLIPTVAGGMRGAVGPRAFGRNLAPGGVAGLARKLISSGTRGGLEAAEAAGARPTPYLSAAPFEGGDFAEGKPLHSRVVDGERVRLGNSEDDVGWVAGRQARKYADEIDARQAPMHQRVKALEEKASASAEDLVPVTEKLAEHRRNAAPWEGLSADPEEIRKVNRVMEILARGERGDVHASRQALLDKLKRLDDEALASARAEAEKAPLSQDEIKAVLGDREMYFGKRRPGTVVDKSTMVGAADTKAANDTLLGPNNPPEPAGTIRQGDTFGPEGTDIEVSGRWHQGEPMAPQTAPTVRPAPGGKPPAEPRPLETPPVDPGVAEAEAIGIHPSHPFREALVALDKLRKQKVAAVKVDPSMPPKGFITQAEREMARQAIMDIGGWRKNPALRQLYTDPTESEPADLRAARAELHAHKSLSDKAAEAGGINKPEGGKGPKGDPLTRQPGRNAIETALARRGAGTVAEGGDAALLEALEARDAADPLPGGGIKEALRLAREMRTARALSPTFGGGALSLGWKPAVIRNWESAMVRGVGATSEAIAPSLARASALGNMAAKMEENKRRAMDALRKKMKMGASR